MIGFSIFGAFRTWQIEEATGLSFISEKGVRVMKKSYIVIHAREPTVGNSAWKDRQQKRCRTYGLAPTNRKENSHGRQDDHRNIQ